MFTDSSSLDHLLQAVTAEFGSVHILVNCGWPHQADTYTRSHGIRMEWDS